MTRPLILAIEPDRRQASKVAALAKNRLHAELVSADTTEHAIKALAGRIPDLILTAQFLSPKDDAALADWLRASDDAGTHLQTLVIPVLASGSSAKSAGGGLFSILKGARNDSATDGCDPEIFAAQVREYLDRATEERRAAAEDLAIATAPLTAGLPSGPIHFEVEAVAPSSEETQSDADEDDEAADPWAEIALDSESIRQAGQVSRANEVEPGPIAVMKSVFPIYQPDPVPVDEVPTHPTDPTSPTYPADETYPTDQTYPTHQTYGKPEPPAEALELNSETIDLQRFVEELEGQFGQAGHAGRAGQAGQTGQAGRAGQVLRPGSRQAGRKDEVVADFEDALEGIRNRVTVPEDEPSRPSVASEADSDLWMPLVATAAWPHLEGGVAKAAAAPAALAGDRPAAPPAASRQQSKKKKAKAIQQQGDWSTFDPDQCGFSALLAKLDEITEDPTPGKNGR